MGNVYEPVSTEAITDIDPEVRRSTTIGRWVNASGWRFGVTCCALLTSFVFIINFAILIWTLCQYGLGNDGRQVLYDGSCETVRKLNLVIHLVINIFSTVLLSLSNYCMQCLSAAPRTDVDKAHRDQKDSTWLDIGVPSVRNLFRINRTRVVFWVSLGFSSLPLHLLFNSAVFSSIASYSYPIIVTDSRFLTRSVNMTDVHGLSHLSYQEDNYFRNGTKYTTTYSAENILTSAAGINSSASRLSQKVQSGMLQRLEVADCISAYAKDFVTSHGGLVLILSSPTQVTRNYSTAPIYEMTPNWSNEDNVMYSDWSLSDGANEILTPGFVNKMNRLSAIQNDSAGWKPFNQASRVDYCLSEELPERCKLQASFHIVIIVLILNIVKASLMFATVFKIGEAPLLTVGDAVASFINRPDSTTRNECLTSKAEMAKRNPMQVMPRPYSARRQFWFSAVSRQRWLLCFLMIMTAIIVSGSLLDRGKNRLRELGINGDVRSLWKLGIGAISILTIIDWSVPSEVILSLIYFTYNGVMTCMWLAAEWNGFAQERKGLRVSDRPQGAQRSTYFLQLPYRIAIPLMVISGLLHWLVSQSIFLVNIDGYWWDNETGEYKQDSNYTGDMNTNLIHRISCGFSPISILFVILIGLAMIVAAVVVGLRRFDSSIPLATSSSIIISACCHLDPLEMKEGDISLKPLQ